MFLLFFVMVYNVLFFWVSKVSRVLTTVCELLVMFFFLIFLTVAKRFFRMFDVENPD